MFKKSFLMMVLIAMFFNSIGINAQTNENKVELNQSGVIDSIVIDPDELWHGDLTKITVTFSEKVGTKLTSNSIITMDAPTDLDVFQIYKDDPILIKYNNEVIGIAYTTNNQKKIVMEFNENVDNGYNHAGSFFLSAKATFTDAKPTPNIVQEHDFETSMGTDAPNTPYKIKYTYVTGTSPFFYKPNGAIWTNNPNYVNWWLHINRNRDSFPSNLKITDTLHQGQQFALIDPNGPVSVDNLDPSHFFITRENDEGSQTISVQAFINAGYGTFEFISDNTFIMTFDQQASLPNFEYTVRYEAKITPEGKYQPKFYNDAIGEYMEAGNLIIKEQLNKKADNISSGGYIAPEKGSLRILKLAKHGENTGLLGKTTFKLFHENGDEVLSGSNNGVFETQENGQVTTPPLDPGKYYVTELSAPDFVDFDPTIKYPFELNLEDTVGVQLIISNEVKRTNVDVKKVWEDNLDTHEDVIIKLLADDIEVDQVTLSDGMLNHTFTDLPKYTVSGTLIDYTVEEVAIEGYTSKITKNSDTSFTVTNTVVKPNAYLEAEKLVSQDRVRMDEVFEYTILVNNPVEGSDPLKDVVVEDTLPTGLVFAEESVYLNGELSHATMTDTNFKIVLDEVAYQDNHKITFKVKALEGVSGTKINKALITNPEDPENPLEPEVPVTIVPKGILKAEKLVSDEILEPNAVFTYIITVDNVTEGSDPIKDVIVEDTLPEGLKFYLEEIYVNGEVASQAEVNGSSFKLVIDEVKHQETVHVSFHVQVEEGVFGERINKAKVTNPEDPENPEEPEVPVTIIPKGKIKAVKEVSKDIIKANEEFTYTIKVKNITEGSNPLLNVSVLDVLPTGLEFTDKIVRLNGEIVDAVLDENQFELIIDSLKYNEEMSVSFNVRAKDGVYGEIVNKAIVTNPEDPDNPVEPEVPVEVILDGKLEAVKEVSKEIVKPQERFEYRIIVKNTVEGSNPLKQVVVFDKLPEGLIFSDNEIFVDDVKTPTIVLNNSITVTLAEVHYDKPVVISFLVEAEDGVFGTLINKATVTNPEDPDNPEEPEVPVTVKPDGALEAIKEVSQAIVKPEEVFTYTITVKNTKEGSDALEKVRVSDQLPEGLVFANNEVIVEGTTATTEIIDNTITATLDKVVYGQSVSISFKVKALADTYGVKLNKAVVTNPEDPENPEEPEVPVTAIPDAKLNAEKFVSKDVVKPEEEFKYTILVRNTVKGSNPLKDVIVSDTLPEGIVFTDGVILVDELEASATITNNKFEVILDEVAYGKDVEVSFMVKAEAEVHGEHINKASVTNPEDPENPEEPEVPVTVIPTGAMSAIKTVSKETVKPLEVFEYSIVVSNTVEGSNPIKNVLVSDTLPEGLSFNDSIIKVDGQEVPTTISGNKFEVVLEELAYGKDVTVTFSVIADETTAGKLINKAVVTNPEDPENPEEPEVPVTVIPDGVLEASKEVSKATVKPEEVFTYTINVKNTKAGSKALENVLVEDTLPEGLVFVSNEVYVDSQLSESATIVGNTLRVVLDRVNYGDTVKVSFSVKALATEFGERINTAKVTNPEDPENPEEPEVPVTIVPTAALEAEKHVSQDIVQPEEVFTYSIVVRNTVEGSESIKNVLLKDTLPDNIQFTDSVIYVNNEVSHALVSNNSFELVLDQVEYGKEVTVSFDVIADPSSFGTRINKASVINPEDPDNPLEPEVPVEIIPEGRIAAQKEVNKDEVEANEAFEYTIIVKNIVEGSKPLKNIKVIDKLPEGIKYLNKEIFVDGIKMPIIVLDDSFEVIIPELAYGKEVRVTFLAEALEGVFGEKVNIATVVDPEDPDNPEEPEVPVDVLLDGELKAEKLVSKDEVKPNEAFDYTIKVSNVVEGSEAIENVIVKDKLPSGISFTDSIIRVNGDIVSADIIGNSFQLVLERLEYGNDVEVTFEVMAHENTHGIRINKARVINPEDPDNPEEPEVPVTIVPDGKINAEKLVSKAEVIINEEFTYTIKVSNSSEGSKPISNVIVKDTLPEGIVFTDSIIKVNGIESDATVVDQSFTLTLKELAYGEDVEVSFTVKALKGAVGERVNVATVTNPEDPDNPEEPEVPTTILPEGKVEAEKLVSKETVAINEVFEYTIVVHNTVENSSPLKNVIVKDTLPEGLEFVDGIIRVNGQVSDTKVSTNTFELVLEKVQYGEEVSVKFLVRAIEGTEGVLLNVATVIDPENPEEPSEPEVPVTVTPEDPEVLTEEPIVPKEPTDPNTPNTGIGSSENFLMMFITAALGLLMLLFNRKKQSN